MFFDNQRCVFIDIECAVGGDGRVFAWVMKASISLPRSSNSMKQKPVQSTDSLESALGTFISELSYTTIPADAVRLAERCFVDTVGVTLAGATEGAGKLTGAVSGIDSPTGPATVIGHNTTAALSVATLANATAGHGLDFDDVSSGMSGHPSVTMVAPLLALTESESVDGKQLITAFVAGFETQCRLAKPLIPAHYEAGWHATATFGTFGAAAAAANLLGLSQAKSTHALNIAASLPAGLKRNFGSMTKPLHAGNAARSGLTAALLANEGFTADDTAVTGQNGFFDLYGPPTEETDRTIDIPPKTWSILENGVDVKKYPCCYFTHSPISAASTLVTEHEIDLSQIDRIHVTASPGAGDALHHTDPATGLEGKFSMEYTVASGIVRDTVGLAAFDDENIQDESVQSIRERVDFDVDDSVPYGSFESTVTVQLADGTTHSKTLNKPPGTHDDPLSEAELRNKFHMCASRLLDEPNSQDLYQKLNSLRDIDKTDDLLAAV